MHKIKNLTERNHNIVQKRHKNVNLDEKKLQTRKKGKKLVKKKMTS